MKSDRQEINFGALMPTRLGTRQEINFGALMPTRPGTTVIQIVVDRVAN